MTDVYKLVQQGTIMRRTDHGVATMLWGLLIMFSLGFSVPKCLKALEGHETQFLACWFIYMALFFRAQTCIESTVRLCLLKHGFVANELP